MTAVPDPIGKRLEASFPSEAGLGLFLHLVRQIEVFQVSGVESRGDFALQGVREFSLLFDFTQDVGLALGDLIPLFFGIDDRLNPDLKEFDKIYKNFGPVMEVRAKTESGRSLGRISDLLIEAESGIIVRFYLKNLLSERIIPREYLVSITPKQIVFKDIVDQPIFDSLVSQTAEV